MKNRFIMFTLVLFLLCPVMASAAEIPVSEKEMFLKAYELLRTDHVEVSDNYPEEVLKQVAENAKIKLDLHLLQEIRALNSKNDVKKEKEILGNLFDSIKKEKIDYPAKELIQSMIDIIKDPYTRLCTLSKFDIEWSGLNRILPDLGWDLQEENWCIKVKKIRPHSIAEKAGLKPGDRLAKVNGKFPKNVEILSQIFQEENLFTKSNFPIKVNRNGKAIDINMPMNATIKSRNFSVDSEILQSNIGYIKIYSFGEKTGEEFVTQFKSLKDKGIKSLILDLRGNKGGSVAAMEPILQQFIKESVFQTGVTRKETIKHEIRNGTTFSHPIIVLIDGVTCSAAEAVCKALQYQAKAILIGEKTYGKGRGQDSEQISDMYELRYSNSKILGPDGKCYNKKGISPDIFQPSKGSLLRALRELGTNQIDIRREQNDMATTINNQIVDSTDEFTTIDNNGEIYIPLGIFTALAKTNIGNTEGNQISLIVDQKKTFTFPYLPKKQLPDTFPAEHLDDYISFKYLKEIFPETSWKDSENYSSLSFRTK